MTVKHGIVIARDDDGELHATCAKCGRELELLNSVYFSHPSPKSRLEIVPCPGPHDAKEAVEQLRGSDLEGTVYEAGRADPEKAKRDKMRADPRYRLDPTI